MRNKWKRKIIVAVGGASGSIYAQLLLEKLKTFSSEIAEVAVVFSSNAIDIWNYELHEPFVAEAPLRVYANHDFNAPFASGSANYDCMIICPCSMGILGRIANGISNDLITRAADVQLKERRKLIVCLRETPYSLIHIENMKLLTQAGGIVCPATPSFYSKPQDIKQLATTVVDRLLSLAGFNPGGFEWGAGYPDKD